MFEATILIPLTDNNQAPHSTKAWAEFEKQLALEFGGFTKAAQCSFGGWVDHGGNLVTDTSREYAVALGSIFQGEALVRVAKTAKRLFNQDAIYVRYLGQSEVVS